MYEPIEKFGNEPSENFHGVPSLSLSLSLKIPVFVLCIIQSHATLELYPLKFIMHLQCCIFLILHFENLLFRICPVSNCENEAR